MRFILLALIALSCAHRAPTSQSLGQRLNLKAQNLLSFSSGSDAGGCDLDVEAKTSFTSGAKNSFKRDQKTFIAYAETILALPVWSMEDSGIPAGCQNAYSEMGGSGYRFPEGNLHVPSSTGYPPSMPEANMNYYEVSFEEKKFCLESKTFQQALEQVHAKYHQEDCEI